MTREEEFTAAAITIGEERSNRIFEHLLREILSELHSIHRILEPKFTLQIQQRSIFSWNGEKYYDLTNYFDPKGVFSKMAAITAGQSGTFLLSATASDNSTPVLSAQTLTADDANVQIAQDATDPNSFTVTVPASDTQTTFNLSAKAEVTSNTSPTAQEITATLPVTISPAAVPVTFTLSINEK